MNLDSMKTVHFESQKYFSIRVIFCWFYGHQNGMNVHANRLDIAINNVKHLSHLIRNIMGIISIGIYCAHLDNMAPRNTSYNPLIEDITTVI